jgi:hypothetical protein
MAMNYSIHFHVWTHKILLEFLMQVQTIAEFDLEVYAFNKPAAESICILRKRGR